MIDQGWQDKDFIAKYTKNFDEAMAKVNELSKDLPLGYRTVASGQASQLDETTGGLFFALGIGILVAYMVLASQFNSFLHPVTVLTILPLALSGAAIGLLVTGKTLNVFSMIGVLLLMGIVKKNSILLVEYANQVAEHEGLDAISAIRKAGPLRLRPILMTTVATMMAAVPPVLGIGPGSETRSPMAAVVLVARTAAQLESVAAAVCFFPDVAAAVNTTIQVIQMGVPIARCELLDANAVRAVNRHDKLTLREAPLLLMEFHGSEGSVRDGLMAAVGAAKGRVVVTTFASNAARLATLGAVAKATGRTLCVAGRSLDRILGVARTVGYLKDFPPTVDFDEAMRLPRNKVMVIATGGQGEPRAALARMAEGTHPIKLGPGERFRFNLDYCKGCGICANECPCGAIEMVAEET